MLLEKKMISARANSLGFSFVGFAKARQTPHFPKFLEYISENDVGDLTFLSKPYVINGRSNPASLLENAASVIVLGVSYPHANGLANGTNKCTGSIAAYALLPDYHHLLREKARRLVSDLRNSSRTEFNARIFIDSGPMLEKDMAYASGLAWIGKNSLSIHPEHGSFFLICCILTDIDLEIEPRLVADLCADCRQCEIACPTGCIENHRVDISRCVSYLTVEHRGVIPRNLRPQISNRIFGCDTCQSVCPRNLNAYPPENSGGFQYKITTGSSMRLAQELNLSEGSFQEKYGATPIARTGYTRYMRNVVVAAGNSADSNCIPGLKKALLSPSEMVGIHAAWALNQFPVAETEEFLQAQLQTAISVKISQEIVETR